MDMRWVAKSSSKASGENAEKLGKARPHSFSPAPLQQYHSLCCNLSHIDTLLLCTLNPRHSLV